LPHVSRGIAYDSQGNPYYREFVYAKTKDGRTIIVTGHASNLIHYQVERLHEGKPVVGIGYMNSNQQIIYEEKRGGGPVIIDTSVTTRGGQIYDNPLNMWVTNKLGPSAGKFVGVTEGLVKELLPIFNISSMFKPKRMGGPRSGPRSGAGPAGESITPPPTTPPVAE
jgi:hypothetical protein